MYQFNIEKMVTNTTFLRRVLISSTYSLMGNEEIKDTKNSISYYLAKKYPCFGHKIGVFVRNYLKYR